MHTVDLQMRRPALRGLMILPLALERMSDRGRTLFHIGIIVTAIRYKINHLLSRYWMF